MRDYIPEGDPDEVFHRKGPFRDFVPDEEQSELPGNSDQLEVPSADEDGVGPVPTEDPSPDEGLPDEEIPGPLKVPCDICGKEFVPNGIRLHKMKAHPEPVLAD